MCSSDLSEIAYLLAAEAFGRAGGELVNATEGGQLELLPRRRLAQFLEAFYPALKPSNMP